MKAFNCNVFPQTDQPDHMTKPMLDSKVQIFVAKKSGEVNDGVDKKYSLERMAELHKEKV